MGAVVDKNTEPMMVMELMDYGSLHDLLHNDSMDIEGETILPILRDIAQGLRFLHAAKVSVLARTATHCNTLQHTMTNCDTLQHTAAHCSTQHLAGTQ